MIIVYYLRSGGRLVPRYTRMGRCTGRNLAHCDTWRRTGCPIPNIHLRPRRFDSLPARIRRCKSIQNHHRYYGRCRCRRYSARLNTRCCLCNVFRFRLTCILPDIRNGTNRPCWCIHRQNKRLAWTGTRSSRFQCRLFPVLPGTSFWIPLNEYSCLYKC